MAESQLRVAALAALIIVAGAVAEATASAESHLLTVADFVTGSVCALAGLWLVRTSVGLALTVVGVGLAWFAGTAASGWSTGPTAVITVALLAYRVPLLGLTWHLPGSAWRVALGAGIAGCVAVALPLRPAGIVTASMLVVGSLRLVPVPRAHRLDQRSAIKTRGLLAVALGAVWFSTALGATGEGLQVANDLIVSLLVVAVAWPVDVTRSRGIAGAVVIELGASADAVTPVVARLRRILADNALEVRFQTTTNDWVDDTGRPVQPPDPASPNVTHVTTAAGSAVALLHGRGVPVRPDLSSAAAAASGLARERVEIDAEARRQAALVAASRQRLLDTADDERRVLEAELRQGPLRTLGKVEGLLRGVSTPVGEELRVLLLDAVNDLLRVGRGLYPSAASSAELEPALRALAVSAPLETSVEVSGELGALSMSDCALVWFVCSECLTNAVRHAEAKRLTIRCEITDTIRVTVTDDGRGGASIGDGQGLRGLADRLDTVGGQLNVDSPPGGPTVVVASVPASRTEGERIATD
jgi:signal transduction histidine kinase